MAAERYKIYDKLGAGGVGAVFRAYDNELKRWVAIKRLLSATDASGDAGTAAELRREADALASLRNPNIVTIFDVANDAEGLFMVMELLEGEDLADVVARGPLHYDDFKELASQTLEGLLAAHQRHILHRDIKPENIKVERLPGGRMQAKIIDFGLARSGLRGRKQTEDQEGSVMGSIYYMAPEQLTREPVDERTDLYALGCVFFEALSGRKAFNGDSVGAVIDAHIHHDLIPLHVVAPHVPPWLGSWVLRLMAQKPEDRPVNAQQAIEELRAWEKLASAPQVMPWMPMGYGGYMPAAQAPYPTATTGSETVPLGGGASAVPQEELIYYAQPVIEAQATVEVGAMTSPLVRTGSVPGRTPTGRGSVPVGRQSGPVGRHTAPMRATSNLRSAPQRPEEGSKAGLYIGLGAGALVLILLGWWLFGRGGGGTDGDPSAPNVVAFTGPPKVRFELPTDRALPPVGDDIFLHGVATTGTLGSRKGGDGKLATAAVNEPVVEWHDVAGLAGDNILRAPGLTAANGPKRAVWRPAASGSTGAKPNRQVLDFRARDGKPNALALADPGGEKKNFPFGTGARRGDAGMNLALVFQVEATRLPTQVLKLSGDGAAVILSVDGGKNMQVEFTVGGATQKLVSKDVDATQPCLALISWNAATGIRELRLRDAAGKTSVATSQKAPVPTNPLFRLQVGAVQGQGGQPALPHEQFSGYLAELILHSSALKTDQMQLMDKALRDFYFQALPAVPKSAPPAKK